MCELFCMAHLSAYLAETGTTQRDFAAKVNTSPSYINELTKGLKTPSLELAFSIERETGGAVPAASWVAEQNIEAAE